MKKEMRGWLIPIIVIIVTLTLGQAISYLAAPASWSAFLNRVPVIVSMIAFWGPIIAAITGLLVWIMMQMMGFASLEEIRKESVEQNNPTPAIIFIGTLIASILFLMLVIRP